MELIKIGFLTIKIVDVIDILIVSAIFYAFYKIMRGTIAFQIFIALILIIGLSLLAQLLNLQTVGWLLSRITDIWVIAFIILFQPELRRMLSIIGRTRIARIFLKSGTNEMNFEIVEACRVIQGHGWGALIVLVRSTGLENIIENGELLQSNINKELIISIFNPKSPLHDGAVLIYNNKIEAARCTLPLSENAIADERKLGTRHRAGLGITEESDAFTIIVSEETSEISVAENGKLTKCRDIDDLQIRLKNALGYTSMSRSFKNLFDDTSKDKKVK
ncbi:MAG TPA: diadenylate cyclase CdaA [Ignavibacteria bacterium]|nr:diadenylate cyclase CdaA [Ignavibacteria bacterium]